MRLSDSPRFTQLLNNRRLGPCFDIMSMLLIITIIAAAAAAVEIAKAYLTFTMGQALF